MLRGLGRRLGDAEHRRRRHLRFGLLAVTVLVVAAVLTFVLGDDDGDDGFRSEATDTCQAFRERVQREFALSFPEGAPSADAEAEYLSHAFADTMDELVAALRALEGPDDEAEAVDALASRIAEIRADPAAFVAAGEDPFAADVAPAFDALDLPACGSEFFGVSS